MRGRCVLLLAALCTGAHGAVCPGEVVEFANFLCSGFAQAVNDSTVAQGPGFGVVEDAKVVLGASDDCLTYETTCIVTHTVLGVQNLTDTYDFSNPCDRKMIYSHDYTFNDSGQVTNDRTKTIFEVGEKHELVTYENLFKGRPDKEFLRIQIKEGTLQTAKEQKTGLFAHFEMSRGSSAAVGDLEVVFAKWLHLSRTREYSECETGYSVVGAGYTVFSDNACGTLSHEVTFNEADGICSRVTCRQGYDYLPNHYGVALCEGDTLYLSQIYQNTSQCLAFANTSLALRQKAMLGSGASSFSVSQDRGRCIQMQNGASFRISPLACTEQRPNSCSWKSGRLQGDRIRIGDDMSMHECRNEALSHSDYGKWCGLAWVPEVSQGGSPIDPDTITERRTCYAISGSCKGPYLRDADGEWSCLVRSTSDEDDNGTDTAMVVIFLVVVLCLCPLLVFTSVVLVRRYHLNKAEQLAQSRGGVVVDSGRTTGIVTGVPIPAVREQTHPEDDACSAADFSPDPTVTTNPLQEFPPPPSAREAVSGTPPAAPSTGTPSASPSQRLKNVTSPDYHAPGMEVSDADDVDERPSRQHPRPKHSKNRRSRSKKDKDAGKDKDKAGKEGEVPGQDADKDSNPDTSPGDAGAQQAEMEAVSDA